MGLLYTRVRGLSRGKMRAKKRPLAQRQGRVQRALVGGWFCQALTAPDVMPSMYSRELNMNITSSGIVAMTKPAIIAP